MFLLSKGDLGVGDDIVYDDLAFQQVSILWQAIYNSLISLRYVLIDCSF
jgi:hypothetical protein